MINYKLLFILLIILFLNLSYYFYQYKSRLQFDKDHSWLIINNNKDFNNTIVPKIIYQTYKHKNIPQKVDDNFKAYAKDFQRIIFDDNEARLFIKENFHPKVLYSFDNFHHGAHKADLFRYCVLYLKGGIYMDIKTVLIENIDKLIKDNCITTVISKNPNEIYQGVIAAPAKQSIFLTLIAAIIDSPINPPYNLFINEFMRFIKKDLNVSNYIIDGYYIGKKHNYNLYLEKCSKNAKDCIDGLDKYKLCCKIYNNDKQIIKTRYSDYPW